MSLYEKECAMWRVLWDDETYAEYEKEQAEISRRLEERQSKEPSIWEQIRLLEEKHAQKHSS